MLKEHQRAALAKLGIRRVFWSFDPLMAKNAYFNFNRLAASVVEYVPDMYGTTASPLHLGLPTDRIVVTTSTSAVETDGHQSRTARCRCCLRSPAKATRFSSRAIVCRRASSSRFRRTSSRSRVSRCRRRGNGASPCASISAGRSRMATTSSPCGVTRRGSRVLRPDSIGDASKRRSRATGEPVTTLTMVAGRARLTPAPAGRSVPRSRAARLPPASIRNHADETFRRRHRSRDRRAARDFRRLRPAQAPSTDGPYKVLTRARGRRRGWHRLHLRRLRRSPAVHHARRRPRRRRRRTAPPQRFRGPGRITVFDLETLQLARHDPQRRRTAGQGVAVDPKIGTRLLEQPPATSRCSTRSRCR